MAISNCFLLLYFLFPQYFKNLNYTYIYIHIYIYIYREREREREHLAFALWSSIRGTSEVVLVVKNPPANTEGIRDADWIPGSGRSPGEGNGYPLQYSCLQNPMDREAWWATVHSVAKQLSMNTHTLFLTHIIFIIQFSSVQLLSHV